VKERKKRFYGMKLLEFDTRRRKREKEYRVWERNWRVYVVLVVV